MIIVLYNNGCEKEIARCHFNGEIDDAHVYAKTLMKKYPNALYYEVYSEVVYNMLNN